MSQSGPLGGFGGVTADGVLECHGLVRSWGLGMSRSGALMGFWSTVWSAHGVLECHGLVRSWGLRVSRSGPLMG